MAHPVLIPVGVGLALATVAGVGLRLRAKSKTSGGITPAVAAAANAQLQQQVVTGVANGTVRLGTNGVPFVAIPSTPPADPSVVVAGLTDPTTKLIGILPNDQLTVNAGLLAQSMQNGSNTIPGFQSNENILFQVTTTGQVGNMAPDPASGAVSQGSTGPIVAESRDARFNPGAPIQIPLAAITGVQTPDAAQLDAKLAATATQKP